MWPNVKSKCACKGQTSSEERIIRGSAVPTKANRSGTLSAAGRQADQGPFQYFRSRSIRCNANQNRVSNASGIDLRQRQYILHLSRLTGTVVIAAVRHRCRIEVADQHVDLARRA